MPESDSPKFFTAGYRVLGFDFGLKRIGTATGNKNTGTCQALSVIRSSQGNPDWAVVDRLINEWKPRELVVGLPISMTGEETEMSGLARNFGARLAGRYTLPVIYADERLTSHAADNILRAATPIGKKTKTRRPGARDNLAAQLILESYFKYNLFHL